VLAGLVTSAVLVLTACGTREGGTATQRSTLPSSAPSIDRPSAGEPDRPSAGEPGRTTGATRTESARPTREPDRTTPPAETAGVPPAPRPTTQTTPPATTTQATTPPVAAAPPAATPAAAEPDGLGALGWLVLLGLVATMIVGGALIHRSQQKSTWDAEARGLEGETRTVTATRLPLVLTATSTEQRGLAWPPVRDNLIDLVNRWDALTLRARDEPQRNRSSMISGLLQDLVAAVDAENEALAYDNNWMLLRPRVSQAEQALATALA